MFVNAAAQESFGIVSLIKSGRQGDVYKIFDPSGGLCALKEPKAGRNARKVQREIDCLRSVNGATRVVKFLGVVNTPVGKYIVTEDYFRRAFHNLLIQRGNSLTKPE
ncbi:hypothetical protein BGW39_004300, partial [Mortierella sp. 14UC]